MRISRPVDMKPGYLETNVKSHFIIFRRDGAGLVAVICILHSRMDVEWYFQ
jgi:toxin ParE1/3/4